MLKEDGLRAVGARIQPLEVIYFVYLQNNSTLMGSNELPLEYNIFIQLHQLHRMTLGRKRLKEKEKDILCCTFISSKFKAYCYIFFSISFSFNIYQISKKQHDV